MPKKSLTVGIIIGLVVCAGVVSGTRAAQTKGEAIAIDSDDLAGTVAGPSGPEAGVWVIAETTDLPTPFARIVVTDDRGRYLVPDLPKASYRVWVRGYGLVDSPKIQTTPGKNLDLRAVSASSPAEAAHYYPAAHWLSLMEMPAKSEFPGTGDSGNGISPNMKSQGDWIRSVKSGGCTACHALGTKGTREIPAALGPFPTSVAAWDRRVKSGQAGGQMSAGLNNFGRARVLKMFADWTDRIRAGELPPAPQRPQGIERNVVITQWDWADPKAYLHDVVSTDRRNPRVNPNGPVYGALELSADYVPVLNPVTNTASQVPLTVRDANTPPTSPAMPEPSPYWADEVIWTSKNNVHNPMLDHKGRVWLTSTVRPAANPPECKEGSSSPLGEAVPRRQRGPPSRCVRPGDEEADAHQHLLRNASPDVRRGRESHAVDQRWWTGDRLAEHKDVRRNAGRDEVAGLDRADQGCERKRQARRVRRTRSAARPEQGSANRRRALRRRAGA